MSKQTLILDLDGTLARTHLDLISVLNRTIQHAGLSPLEVNQVGFLVGKGVKAMIGRAFELQRQSLSDQDLSALTDRYLEDYRENICVDTELYPNVEASLDRFLDAGWTLAVCTNKLEGLATDLLVRLGIHDRFSAVTGADTFEFRKPDKRHLLETVSLAGGHWEGAVMVGDSVTDISAARNAQIPVVGVTFGYSDRPISELNPDRVISDFDQLFDAAKELDENRSLSISPAR